MLATNTHKYLNLYKSFDFNVFLGLYKSKKPGIDWLKYKYERVDENIQLLLMEKNNNVFVMTGETSNNLVVIDVDDYDYFVSKLRGKEYCVNFLDFLNKCYYYRGIDNRRHYVFTTNYDLADLDEKYLSRGVIQGPDCKYTLLYRACTPFPGSTHPEGEPYLWNDDKVQIPYMNFFIFEKMIQELFEVPDKKPIKDINYDFKPQNLIDMDLPHKIFEVIKEYYKEGTRNVWWMGLSGELCKRNMFYECVTLLELLKPIDGRDYESRCVTFKNTVDRIKNNQPVAGFNYIERITKYVRPVNNLKEILKNKL